MIFEAVLPQDTLFLLIVRFSPTRSVTNLLMPEAETTYNWRVTWANKHQAQINENWVFHTVCFIMLFLHIPAYSLHYPYPNTLVFLKEWSEGALHRVFGLLGFCFKTLHSTVFSVLLKLCLYHGENKLHGSTWNLSVQNLLETYWKLNT